MAGKLLAGKAEGGGWRDRGVATIKEEKLKQV